jgi:amylosucrase
LAPRDEVAELTAELLEALEQASRASDGIAPALDAEHADALLTRATDALPDAVEALHEVYGATVDLHALGRDLLRRVVVAASHRDDALRRVDRRREIQPDWFQRPSMLGYVCYVDRFATTLRGVADRLDHLTDLGVTYLHLMPLLQTRPGDDDGGYAVSDYRSVQPELGTIGDLESLAAELRARDMSLCVDVVVNHTAYEHEWAAKARAGDPHYRAYYHVYDDRTLPDQYEAAMRDVFPQTAPGSFTWDDDLRGWVWTTFNPFQWDLNHANPHVFAEMLDVMLFLANRGADVLRIDAAPFIWKRAGTGSENQPEAHRLLQAWRALLRIAAPAVAFKAEAIVGSDQLVAYLGRHERFRPECDLAYHNQLMVMMWSSLATRDARLASVALERMADHPPSTAWCTYVRCHDDIGWAVMDEDAAAVGWAGADHRRFLAEFYAGRFAGSFGAGADFQPDPGSGGTRTSGTAASLVGIEAALATHDEPALIRGIRRLLLLQSVAFSFGGVPLVYMGDEIGLVNDVGWRADATHARDNRWMHRPAMDWHAAALRHDESTVPGVIFGWFARLAAARRRIGSLHAAGPTRLVATGDDRLFAYRRHHPRHAPFVAIVNFDEEPAWCSKAVLRESGVEDIVLHNGASNDDDRDVLRLEGLSFTWIAA